MDRKTQFRVWPFLSAVILTLIAGWSGFTGFSFALFCLGIVGAIPMILIESPHGGTHVENIIGGAAFVVVNVLFYYFVLNWVLARMFRARRGNQGNG